MMEIEFFIEKVKECYVVYDDSRDILSTCFRGTHVRSSSIVPEGTYIYPTIEDAKDVIRTYIKQNTTIYYKEKLDV